MPKTKVCQMCGKELIEGMSVIRVQYGKIHYCKHVGVTRKASTDDYFCQDCEVAIRTGWEQI